MGSNTTSRRFEILQAIYPILTDGTTAPLVVCNIGYPSQELYSLGDHDRFFYMLGSMGLSSSIGLGLSRATDRPVVSIDGDGSVLMNLGTLSTIGVYAPANYTLLVVDNGAYGSTGDQPTHTSRGTDLAAIARGCGVADVKVTKDPAGAASALKGCIAEPGPHVIITKAAPGSPPLSPIPLTPEEIRDRFRREVSRR